MSRSPYIDNVVLTSKHSGRRTHKVQAFVIHHMAAKWTGKRCAEYFRDTPSRQASANYCIGYDGDVALNVEEGNRAWTSSSAWADNRAITYELGNSKTGHPWEVSDKTLNKLIVMLAEQHKRYGLKKASYTGDTSGTLWRHDWFASTNCPGPYLGGKLSYIANEVNKILTGKESVPAPSKSIEQLANEVIAGKHGTGEARKKALGSNYQAVQNLVNKKLSAKPTSKPTKSIDQLAREVIDGKHGTGEARKKALGNQYNAVQKRVNEILGAKPKVTPKPSKSIETLAREVIDGKHGTGDARKKSLGSQYQAVQKRVNQMLGAGGSNRKSIDTIAREVIDGKWGNDPERSRKLRSAGYDAKAVQRRVNQLL